MGHEFMRLEYWEEMDGWMAERNVFEMDEMNKARLALRRSKMRKRCGLTDDQPPELLQLNDDELT